MKILGYIIVIVGIGIMAFNGSPRRCGVSRAVAAG